MFSIDRRAKRRRTGVAYTPGRGPTLTNKANFVLMNGKIVDRSQFMGVNFKDDTRNQTFVNIAEAGYASDAIASRGVASDGPINVQAAGQSMVNIRELAGFLGMLVEDDEKVANLLSQYKTLFAEMYHILDLIILKCLSWLPGGCVHQRPFLCRHPRRRKRTGSRRRKGG